VIRFRFFAFIAVLSATVLAAGVSRAVAAAPTPAPAASASPAPSPTPTPEALDVQIPRLEALLKTNPNDKDSMVQLAADYMSINRPDEAVVLTQKLIAGGTKTSQVYFIDGAAQAGLGKNDAAIASMEQARNLAPDNLQILVPLTQLYMGATRMADAERVAKSGLTLNPTSEDAAENFGFVLAAEKKYDDARAQFENAAQLAPKDPHPVVLEARTFEDQNQLGQAMPLLDRALGIDPNNLEALAGKAELAGTQHDVKTAVATYTTILGLMKDDVSRAGVTDQIAALYARENQDTDADATFRKAIDDYGSLPPAHLAYGDYLAAKKDLAGANREWTIAVGPNRDNPDALARLGQLAAQGNDFNKAIDNFKRLTEVVSADPRPYLMLGEAYMQNKNYDKAHDAFKASYNLAHSLESLAGIAAADQETHNYTEALQIYGMLAQNADLVKQQPGVLFNLATTYKNAGQTQKAKDTYTQFLGFLKPGSQGYTQVKQIIADLDRGSQPAPKPSAKPAPKPTAKPAAPAAKPSSKPSPKPSASAAPAK
jgi:tetratricopeptide (TPR) repeat protein